MTDEKTISPDTLLEMKRVTEATVTSIREILAESKLTGEQTQKAIMATQLRLQAEFSSNSTHPPETLIDTAGHQASDRKTEELIKAINALGRNLEGAARNIRSIANDIEVDRDVARTSEVTEIISNLLGNLRLDELVLLPLQVMELKLMEHQQKPRENI